MRYVEGTDLRDPAEDRGSARVRREPSRSSPRWARHSTPPMHEGWCTATSSRRTCSSPPSGAANMPTSQTSASPCRGHGRSAARPARRVAGLRRARADRAAGVVDARSDVYSLGCVLFECLTGSVPFRRGSEFEVLYAQLSEEPPAISEERTGLPRELDQCPGACARKAPEERFETAGALVSAARAALPAWRGTPPRWSTARRSPRLAIVIAAATAVGVWAWVETGSDLRTRLRPTWRAARCSGSDPVLGRARGHVQALGPVERTSPPGRRVSGPSTPSAASWSRIDPSIERGDHERRRDRRAVARNGKATIWAGRRRTPTGMPMDEIDPERGEPSCRLTRCAEAPLRREDADARLARSAVAERHGDHRLARTRRRLGRRRRRRRSPTV